MTVDLRSDTVTRPTDGMRRAMAEADVGDDVYGEDPSLNRLEERTAQLLGKEAAVFVPTGTMGNQASVKALTHPGDEAIAEAEAHLVYYERAGVADLSGVQIRALHGTDGVLDPEEVAAAVRESDLHFPTTRLLCLENTHNRAGGRVVPVEAHRRLVATAKAHGVRVHLDGARLWNAAVALGASPAELADGVDTVTVCYSKGLGAPVGSCIAGSAEVIGLVRRVRKVLGGGMRQAGILGAAALYALDHHMEGLADDHRRAGRLAAAVAEMPGMRLDPAAVETNIVLVVRPAADAAQLVAGLRAEGVLATRMAPHQVRMVTHLDVDDAGIDQAIAALSRVSRALRAAS